MCVADAGELEELRRVDGAAAEDDLARADDLAAVDLDADGPRALEHDLGNERPAADLEVRSAHGGMEVGARGAEAAAAPDRPVERGEALLSVAVDVVRELVAGLLHRLEERGEE